MSSQKTERKIPTCDTPAQDSLTRDQATFARFDQLTLSRVSGVTTPRLWHAHVEIDVHGGGPALGAVALVLADPVGMTTDV